MSTTFNVSVCQSLDKILTSLSRHHFTHALTVILPGTNIVPEAVSESFSDQLSYKLSSLPVYRLIERPFIQAFIKGGSVYMLSANTKLDTHNSVAITPDGQLILHLTKDTYQELGLEATKQTHFQKSNDIYVVKINLLADYFKPGKKNYDSTLWCLKNRLGLAFDFHIAWEPKESKVCSSSVAAYFLDKCECVERTDPVWRKQVLSSVACPKVMADDPTGSLDKSCHFQDVFEWMGALACGVDIPADYNADASFSSSYWCPEPNENCPRSCLFQASGFITPGTVCKVAKAVRQYADQNIQSPPPSLTLHGFRDSPFVSGKWPNHYHMSGDNLGAVLCLPEDKCWLYQAVAS